MTQKTLRPGRCPIPNMLTVAAVLGLGYRTFSPVRPGRWGREQGVETVWRSTVVRFIAFAAGVLALALIYGVHHFYTEARLDRAIIAWSNSYIWDSVGSTSAPTFTDQAVEPGPNPDSWRIEGILTAAQGDGSRLHGRYSAVLQKICGAVAERRCWRLADLKLEQPPIATAEETPGASDAESGSIDLAISPETAESMLPTALIQPKPAPMPTVQQDTSSGAPILEQEAAAGESLPTAREVTLAPAIAPPPVIATAMAERQAAERSQSRTVGEAAPAQPAVQPEAQQHVRPDDGVVPRIPAPHSRDSEGASAAATAPEPTTVLAIQQHLIAQGIYGGPLDAEMGPATREAIQAYQSRHGLTPDGLPSEALLAHLDRQGGPASAGVATNLAGFKIVERSAVGTAEKIAGATVPAAAPAAGPVPGTAGTPPDDTALPAADESLVFLIQDRLAALGYGKTRALPRNGRLDARTRQAIASYQRKNGLSETGLPSPGLLDHIERYVKRLRAIERGGTGLTGKVEPASAIVVASSRASEAPAGAATGNGYHAFQLAMAAVQKGQTERAIVLFSRAIQSNDWREKHLAYLLRGKAFAGVGNHRQAVNDFSAALLLKPDYVEALVNRGNAYAKLNRPDKAIADFRKGQALDPGNPAVAAEMAKLAAGN